MTAKRSAALAAGFLCYAAAVQAQPVTLTAGSQDAVIRDHLCLGQQCATDPTDDFLDSTASSLLITDTRTRIDTIDTSADATFPGDDWSLHFNDVLSRVGGGRDHFSIQNRTENTTPFQIIDDAPTNAFFMADDGDIGFGTALPQAELHIVRPNVAEVRLEVTNGEGNWRIASGTSGLGLFDGFDFPFFIRNGAPSSALAVNSNGDVGMGTSDPTAPLHVRRFAASNADMLRLESNGAAIMRLIDSNSGTSFTFQNQGSTFRVASPLVPGPELTLTETGDLTITGELVTAGSCSVGCDRVFDADYGLRPMAEHHALMWSQKHLPAIGPTAEDGPMNLSQKMGGVINELEHAHIYIDQLHERVEAQDKLLRNQQQLLEAYRSQIEAHDARLQRLEDG